MLEQLIKLYTAYMIGDVRSPVPHLAGPPGVGKSQSVERLAELVGKKLHIVNVSRISPLELEGVQMPSGTGEDMRLRLLHNTLWTELQEGDIVLLDEFLRGFPEVYNGLLDIMTSRQVAGFQLPKVFFIAASNSVTAYDPALEDRLLHLFVPDIRRGNSRHRKELRKLIVEEMGLHPDVVNSQELDHLIADEVEPMYELLDMFKNKKRTGSTALRGQSVRKLIGQVKLRQIESVALKDLITYSNELARQTLKYQYVIIYRDGEYADRVKDSIRKLNGHPKLTPQQQQSVTLNIALLDMFEATRPVQQATEPLEEVEEDDPNFI